jgi:hypothetical protein
LGVLWLNEAERLREGERPGEGVPSGTPPAGGEAAEKANSDSDLLKGLKNRINEKRCKRVRPENYETFKL